MRWYSRKPGKDGGILPGSRAHYPEWVYRVYCVMKLNLRIRRRLPKRFPEVLEQPKQPNECW